MIFPTSLLIHMDKSNGGSSAPGFVIKTIVLQSAELLSGNRITEEYSALCVA